MELEMELELAEDVLRNCVLSPYCATFISLCQDLLLFIVLSICQVARRHMALCDWCDILWQAYTQIHSVLWPRPAERPPIFCPTPPASVVSWFGRLHQCDNVLTVASARQTSCTSRTTASHFPQPFPTAPPPLSSTSLMVFPALIFLHAHNFHRTRMRYICKCGPQWGKMYFKYIYLI